MDKFDELLQSLQKLDIKQNSLNFLNDLKKFKPDLYYQYFSDIESYTIVGYSTEVEYRYYTTSIQVIKIYNRYLGIDCIVYRSVDCSDDYFFDYSYIFYEMNSIQSVSYEIKNNLYSKIIE